MMKRFATLFLTKVYIITAFGFALNLHYCGNVLAAVNIITPAKSGKMLMGMKMKCCKEKQVEVKIKDVHQGESQSIVSKLFGFEIPRMPFGDYVLSAQKALLEKLSDPAPPPAPPPPSGKTAHFIKNCSLRI